MEDSVGAFVSTFRIDGAPGGPLAGLSFCAKDIYDVAGHPTGCGSPDWLATHPVPDVHAAPIAQLLDAGATLVGKSHTDEIAYSLMGVNAHYGTPVNTAAPDRIPGGSSSGSVAAVAAGLVEIGLGSDTGGSVRMPASFCGVWGMRTTHGSLPMDGAMPLAPSFDTVGWFTSDATTLDRVCAACGLAPAGDGPVRLLLPVDAWAAASADTVAALAPALARLQALHGPVAPVVLVPEGLPAWFECFRVCQASEIWQTHGAWVETTRPAFGPGIAERFAMAAAITAAQAQEARAVREKVRARVRDLIDARTVLVLPASPGPAPLRDADPATLDAFRTRAIELLCAAGLAGLPQLTMPAGSVDDAPVGLGLVGAAGRERLLLQVAAGGAGASW